MTRVKCPSRACGALFELAGRRLGRSTHCPVCGVRMTARPLAVEKRLREQERRIEGGAGADVMRLPLAVLVDDVRSLWNVGSIFRTADACGVERIVLTGITGCPPRNEISKTALGAERAVAWSYAADAARALAELRAAGHVAIALETTPRAVELDRFEWPARPLLVVGNEVAGVSPPVLDACEHHVRIPMQGVKSSLNVAVAFGIAAFRASRALAGRAGVEVPR